MNSSLLRELFYKYIILPYCILLLSPSYGSASDSHTEYCLVFQPDTAVPWKKSRFVCNFYLSLQKFFTTVFNVDLQIPCCNTWSTYAPMCTSDFAITFTSFTYHTQLPRSFIHISPPAVKLHLGQKWPLPNTVDQIRRLHPSNPPPSTYQQYYKLQHLIWRNINGCWMQLSLDIPIFSHLYPPGTNKESGEQKFMFVKRILRYI
jgi:hypothetical protein